jgi:hypothetical protein
MLLTIDGFSQYYEVTGEGVPLDAWLERPSFAPDDKEDSEEELAKNKLERL